MAAVAPSLVLAVRVTLGSPSLKPLVALGASSLLGFLLPLS